MRKDRTIISELQDFFLQNDTHLAINSISDVMSSLKLHKNNFPPPLAFDVLGSNNKL